MAPRDRLDVHPRGATQGVAVDIGEPGVTPERGLAPAPLARLVLGQEAARRPTPADARPGAPQVRGAEAESVGEGGAHEVGVDHRNRAALGGEAHRRRDGEGALAHPTFDREERIGRRAAQAPSPGGR